MANDREMVVCLISLIDEKGIVARRDSVFSLAKPMLRTLCVACQFSPGNKTTRDLVVVCT